MLALRHFTQSFLPPHLLVGLAESSSRLTWPAVGLAGACLLLGPSWLARSTARRRWVACSDGHFKNA